MPPKPTLSALSSSLLPTSSLPPTHPTIQAHTSALEQQLSAHLPEDAPPLFDASGQALSGLDDFDLPKTTINRLVRGEVGEAKVQGEAVVALQKGATVFINYLADAALEISHARGAKTVNPQDIYKALEAINFGPPEELRPVLEEELEAFHKVRAEIRAHTLQLRNAANAASRARLKGKQREEQEGGVARVDGEGEGEDGDEGDDAERDDDGLDARDEMDGEAEGEGERNRGHEGEGDEDQDMEDA